MLSFIFGVILGVIIGVTIGVVLMCALAISGSSDIPQRSEKKQTEKTVD